MTYADDIQRNTPRIKLAALNRAVKRVADGTNVVLLHLPESNRNGLTLKAAGLSRRLKLPEPSGKVFPM